MSTSSSVPSFTKTDYGYLLQGSDGDDHVSVVKTDRHMSVGPGRFDTSPIYEVTINGETKEMSAEELSNTSFNLGAGDDVFDNYKLDVGVDVVGGDGDDTITGGSGSDRLRGDKGVDDYSGNSNDRDVINGGGGDDIIGATTGYNTIDPGEGKDIIYDGGKHGDQNNTLENFGVFDPDKVQRFNPDRVDLYKNKGGMDALIEDDQQLYDASRGTEDRETSTTEESSASPGSSNTEESSESDSAPSTSSSSSASDEAAADEMAMADQKWVAGLSDAELSSVHQIGLPPSMVDRGVDDMVEDAYEDRGLEDSEGVDGHDHSHDNKVHAHDHGGDGDDSDSSSGDADYDIQNLANSDDFEYVGDGEYMAEFEGFDVYLSQPGGEGEAIDATFRFNEGELEGAEVTVGYDSDGNSTGISVDRGDSDLSSDEALVLEKYFNGDEDWDSYLGGSNGGMDESSMSDMDRAMQEFRNAMRDMTDDQIYDKQKKKKNGSTTTVQGGEPGGGGTNSSGDTSSSEVEGSSLGGRESDAIQDSGATDGLDRNTLSDDDGDNSWFLSLAKAMGSLLNKKAREVTGLLDAVKTGENGEEPPFEATARFQAATQQLSYFQTAFTTAINTLGDVIKTGVTAGGAAR
jgi:hypothetical protein